MRFPLYCIQNTNEKNSNSKIHIADHQLLIASKMEYQYSRRTRDTYAIPKTFPNYNLALRPDFMIPETKPIFLERPSYTTAATSRYYQLTTQHEEVKLAGLKIFATIMLKAWRRRREDVKRLMEKVDDLKKGSMKAKNQIHVYNTLFRVEQKRNDELTCQLKRSIENINHTKSSCESLTTTVISLRADKALMEQELQLKYSDIEALNCVLNQTKSDLFRCMVDQRSLHSNLCKERRNVQFLEKQKNKLIDEICELGSENRKTEGKFCQQLDRRNEEIKKANAKIKQLEESLIDLKEKAFQVQEYRSNDAHLKAEVQLLRTEVTTLQRSLEESLGNRLRGAWNNMLGYQKMTLQLAHLFAFYLLPATPPPKFTFTSKHHHNMMGYGCL